MKSNAIVLPAGLLLFVIAVAQEPVRKAWKKRVLTTDFLTEGLSAGDLDGDGKTDLVAGAFWFKGPDFTEAKAYRPGRAMPVKSYMEDSFLSWVDDLDGDGKNDILMASHPGKDLTLYLNPGREGDWPAHRVMTQAATESPLWADLDGDGNKELVCMQSGCFGYAEVDWSEVTRPWTFVKISEKRANTPYLHGLGIGDLSGDGRPDIVEKDGWFEQPAESTGKWIWHEQKFAGRGGAQMLVFDVDGDGDQDMITSMDGHGYGLAWFENSGTKESITFKRHEILPEDPSKTGADGLQFSQLHALESGDFDGDGRLDFITGKRYYAHNGKDPGAEDPALAVVFHNRFEGGKVTWKSEVIDSDSGVGCQVLAVDLNGDGMLEFAAGSKKGVHVIGR
jgi:hypothetical protein